MQSFSNLNMIFNTLECSRIQADPNFIDIALNDAYVRIKIKGDRIGKDDYTMEGSNCRIKPDFVSASTISADIESIGDDYVEIKIQDPKTWMYRGSEHQVFEIICDLKVNGNGNATETRTTRPIIGGGPNDGFINGGGIVVVDSNDLRVDEASVQWKKPPMTHDVSRVVMQGSFT